MSKHRSIIFVIHNYTDVDLLHIRSLVANERVQYIRFQQEACPTTGAKHIQGWAQAGSGRTFRAWKTCLGREDVHVQKRSGSVESNERYCSKEETRISGTQSESFGDLPQQGERTDMSGITSAALDLSIPWRDVAMSDPEQFVRMHKGLRELRLSQLGPRTEPTKCFWFYGDTGSGKSRFVHHLCPPESTYWKTGINKWFDAYDPIEHHNVILDDFRASMCEFSFLLRLGDRYPLVVENKGSYQPFRAGRLFFTTPRPITQSWKTVSEENLDQLERRVVAVCHFVRHDGRYFIRVVRGGDVEELRDLPEWLEPFSNLDASTQQDILRREELRVCGTPIAAGFIAEPTPYERLLRSSNGSAYSGGSNDTAED